jgi:hypothetical protein
MIRWVLLLLLGLNLAYLAFSLYWTPDPDPYAGVAPLERLPHAGAIRLIDAMVDPPPQPARETEDPPAAPAPDDEGDGRF